MATLSKNHFEGQTAGVTPTISNSGATGDDAFDVVSFTGLTAGYYTTDSMHGTGSLRFSSNTAGSVGLVGYAGYSTMQAVQRSYIKLTGAPSADLVVVQFRDATAPAFAVRIHPDRTIGVDVGGTTIDSSSYTLTVNTWYRIETAVNVSSSGGIIADVYPGDSTTSLGRVGALSGTVTGTAAIVGCRWGKITGTPTVATFLIDDVATKDAQTSYLGPYVAPPTITGTAKSGVWIIDVSASTAASGGALTDTISPSTGVTQIGPGIFRGTAAGTYTVTVTEAGGTSATKTFTVTDTSAGGLLLKRRVSGVWATV